MVGIRVCVCVGGGGGVAAGPDPLKIINCYN